MKWGTLRMRVLYALMVIGSLIVAAGADTRWA